MENLIINTPAKINLGLNVLRKRDDGYHDLETFFYPINLFDSLTFSESSEFYFTCSNPNLNNENNLVIKAKQLLEDEIRMKIKIKIELQKHIPVGAGLGGGSSDAAATLLGINQFLDLNLNNEILKKLASQLGADVPFFLTPTPSYAEGKGDIIKPMQCSLNHPVLVVVPDIHISTAWAYQNVLPSTPEYALNKLIEDCEIDFPFMHNKIKNDFEPFIFIAHPEIKEIKKSLYKNGAMFSLMSGSGSSVFGIFPNIDKAVNASEVFKDKYFTFLHHEHN
jgi:4-diphosphocytidyl-2-C-methyl-D-erythritol kinase